MNIFSAILWNNFINIFFLTLLTKLSKTRLVNKISFGAKKAGAFWKHYIFNKGYEMAFLGIKFVTLDNLIDEIATVESLKLHRWGLFVSYQHASCIEIPLNFFYSCCVGIYQSIRNLIIEDCTNGGRWYEILVDMWFLKSVVHCWEYKMMLYKLLTYLQIICNFIFHLFSFIHLFW